MQPSSRFRRVAALLAGLALVGCQTPTPPAPPAQSENVADTTSANGKAGAPSNAPSLGAYANVIKSYGAVSDGNKVIRLSEDAFKRLPIGVELSGAEPRGTIVLPMEPVTPKSSRDRKLSGTVDYLGIEGTLVPEPYNFRARMGRNAGFIYGEGSWWNLNVYGRDVGCTAQADQVIGVYHYWWAAGSTGNWWLLSVDSYSSACPLSEFDPVAVGAGTPPSPRPTPTPVPTPTPTPTPPPLELTADESFSPNGDGTKDTANIKIKARDAWTLEVVGYGDILPGSGDTTYAWDGKVNGTVLPDGKYTLRLKSGSEEKSADVTIDTQYPTLDQLSLSEINVTPERKLAYTFKFMAKDDSTGLTSGFNRDEFKATIAGIPEAASEVVSISDSGDGSIKALFAPSETDSSRLDYTIRISDKAGNTVEKSEYFSMEVNYTAAAAEPSQSASRAYELQSTGGWFSKFRHQLAEMGFTVLGIPDNLPFFYNDGSREFVYFVGNQLSQVRNGAQNEVAPFIGVPYMVVFKAQGTQFSEPRTEADKIWLVKKAPTPVRESLPVSVVRWNGRLMNQPLGEIAKSGKYNVTLTYMYEDCECPPLGNGGLILKGVQSKPFNLQPFSVINNGDGLKWGLSRPGTYDETDEAFKQFKKDVGDSGRSHAWHHIVEKQNSYNSNMPIDMTNRTFNLVRVPVGIHYKLNWKPKEAKVLMQLPFPDQWNLGMQRLVQEGWSYPMQEEYK